MPRLSLARPECPVRLHGPSTRTSAAVARRAHAADLGSEKLPTPTTYRNFRPIASTNDIRAAIRPVKYTMKLMEFKISTMCSCCQKPQALLPTLYSRSITIDCIPPLSIPEIMHSPTSAKTPSVSHFGPTVYCIFIPSKMHTRFTSAAARGGASGCSQKCVRYFPLDLNADQG